MKKQADSFANTPFKRVLKHPLGRFGFMWIVLCVVLAGTAYLWIPDSSPHANRVSLHAALLPPGTQMQQFIPRQEEESKVGFLSRLFWGNPHAANVLIFSHSEWKQDTLCLLFNNPEQGLERIVFKKPVQDADYTIQNITFWLGTDHFGRDVLSRLVLGARISLSVGLIAVFIALVLGTTLGLCAGYFQGITDRLIMWFASVLWSLPTLLLVLAVSFALGKGFWQIFVAIGLSSWIELTRVVRGEVIGLKNRPFIQAAQLLKVGTTSILFKHILPNVAGSIIVICTANFAAAILLESGLSFLGLGVKPPTPSWGIMIQEYYGYIMLNKAYLALVPGMAIMMMVVAFNLLGIALRDVLASKA